MSLSKEKMREYQRARRAKMKEAVDGGFPVLGGPCAKCVVLIDRVEGLKKEIVRLGVAPVSAAPAGGCKGCSDRDSANMVLRAKLVMVEKERDLLKKERKGLDAAGVEGAKVSPYRLGPGA